MWNPFKKKKEFELDKKYVFAEIYTYKEVGPIYKLVEIDEKYSTYRFELTYTNFPKDYSTFSFEFSHTAFVLYENKLKTILKQL